MRPRYKTRRKGDYSGWIAARSRWRIRSRRAEQAPVEEDHHDDGELPRDDGEGACDAESRQAPEEATEEARE